MSGRTVPTRRWSRRAGSCSTRSARTSRSKRALCAVRSPWCEFFVLRCVRYDFFHNCIGVNKTMKQRRIVISEILVFGFCFSMTGCYRQSGSRNDGNGSAPHERTDTASDADTASDSSDTDSENVGSTDTVIPPSNGACRSLDFTDLLPEGVKAVVGDKPAAVFNDVTISPVTEDDMFGWIGWMDGSSFSRCKNPVSQSIETAFSFKKLIYQC
jgi:hypothetical protein